jgi:3-hydroxyisobutyrate dehydrogenase-like beta-hydroxyacid dehydrogenase
MINAFLMNVSLKIISPMENSPAIGFIGFGEAGYNIARGLRGAGVVHIFAYDINTRTPNLGERIQRRASESETRLLESSEALAQSSDILLSTVTADAAIAAAEQTAPYLAGRHLYADFNSVSPALKQSIAQIITGRGAHFIEGAILSAVKPQGHRVPILLCGPNARALVDVLAPYGMRFEVISDQIGTASAVKMCRSVIVKGLEALLFECVLGATKYGADQRVLDSLAESIPEIDWGKLADYMIGRVLEHGERRAREMEEVAETLRAIGVEPIMAEATARRQEWGARLNLLDCSGKTPESYLDMLKAFAVDKKD